MSMSPMGPPRGQAPGFYRARVGEVVVTTLSDGDIGAGLAFLQNITPDAARGLLDAAFIPAQARTAINCFAIHAGGRIAIVDAGSGHRMGETAGQLPASLAAAGIDPTDVDTVLLTHLHPDHSYGLSTPDGAALFPKAEVVLHEAEVAFWLAPDATTRVPERAQRYVPIIAETIAPYADRLRPVTGGEVFPGVHLQPLTGHTPGHSGFRIESGGESLLIWGDITHVPDIQLPRPEVTIAFDIDPKAAIAARRRVLDQVASDRLRVAGMHTHFPAFGHVVRDGAGYRLVPEAWRAAGA